ncbi:MAG: type IV pili methyl-accepting chemotaxis transducer N-terminal domain-containing protein, partial [Azovibrio sp.]|nr:type IV pili methyl-accepting chemotaxis transducer N-terminal domain-containing protein [Azovibrio sp.]
MRDSVPGLAYPSNRLLGAVLLFLILDLSVLLINLWIANEVACNAVAINLAGRQRMLSQQISKNLLLLTQTDPQQVPPGTRQELNQGLYLFQQTLSAFAEGSTATDTTLQPVALRAVEGEAALLVSRTRLLIQPLTRLLHSAHPGPTSDPSVLQPANRYMVEHNREILDLMNRLTWRLEEDARQRTRTLQIVQVCAF